MSKMGEHFRTVTDPKEIDALCLKTGLGIQLADLEPEESGFFAAHGENDSFLLCRFDGEMMAWLITSGSKDDRKAVTQEIRDKFTNCKVCKPEGEEEPMRVRLTQHYHDPKTGIDYAAGTILIRSPHGTGQYLPEGLALGKPGAIACFALVQDISETIEP